MCSFWITRLGCGCVGRLLGFYCDPVLVRRPARRAFCDEQTLTVIDKSERCPDHGGPGERGSVMTEDRGLLVQLAEWEREAEDARTTAEQNTREVDRPGEKAGCGMAREAFEWDVNGGYNDEEMETVADAQQDDVDAYRAEEQLAREASAVDEHALETTAGSRRRRRSEGSA